MRSTLFIDTGAFYARYVAADEYHERAMKLWQKVQAEKIPCFTTNFVLSELISLFVYRSGTPSALKAAREIYASNAITIFSITSEIELKALEWMERFADQKFSMTDAASFAVMSEQNLKRAFTFDKHFTIAGFEPFS